MSPGTSRTRIRFAATSTSTITSRSAGHEGLRPVGVDGDPEVVRGVRDHLRHGAELPARVRDDAAALELERPILPLGELRQPRLGDHQDRPREGLGGGAVGHADEPDERPLTMGVDVLDPQLTALRR